MAKRLAVRAKALEMDVVAYDPYFDETFAAAHGIKRVTLDELIREANIISLHLPLNEATKNIINAKRIAAMRYGTILVNTARGGLLDEAGGGRSGSAKGGFAWGWTRSRRSPPSLPLSRG